MDRRVGTPPAGGDPTGPAEAGGAEWRILLGGLRHWYGLVGTASPGACAVELDGVTACVVPAAPERSVLNAVVYRSSERLGAAIDELTRIYEAAGVRAWCAWVPEGDRDPAAALERAGSVLDASPDVMIRGLREIERPPPDALESWSSHGDVAEAAALNDRSYDFGTDSFARGLSGGLHDEANVYVAARGGAAVATVVTTDHEANCEVDLVATVPEARGRGIAGALLGHALADAAERRCETTTLVATSLGRPVYERLGYRTFGTVQMWERRRPE